MSNPFKSATGIAKQVRIAAESSYGVAPSSGGGQLLRRVTSAVDMDIATYTSSEIQPDRQIHDFRHGVQQVKGSIKGELSPLTWESIFATMLAGSFTSGVTASPASSTAVAAIANTSPGTFTRGSGSWITDGFKIGDVVKLSGMGTTGAGNNARNYRITNLSATVMSVGPTPTTAQPSVGNEVVAAVSADAGTTFTVVGKKLVTPAAGSQTDNSFALEHWFSDISQSELYLGLKPSTMAISLPATGLATIDVSFLGRSVTTGGSAYFSSPTAATTSTVTAAVNGLLRAGGVDYGIITGLSLNINDGVTADGVVGSNVIPFVYQGIQNITGQFTAMFFDNVLRDHFLNEDEIALQCYLTCDNTLAADFISFYLPRIKLGGGTKDDKPGSIIATYTFQALKNNAGGTGTTGDATTLTIQDSLAT